MSDYHIPKMEASEDGSSVSIDLTPMVHDLTRQVVKRVEEGAAAEVVAFLAANGHLADEIRKAKAEAWEEGAAEAWRESGTRTYGKSYEDLPDSRFIPLSLRQRNPYTEES